MTLLVVIIGSLRMLPYRHGLIVGILILQQAHVGSELTAHRLETA